MIILSLCCLNILLLKQGSLAINPTKSILNDILRSPRAAIFKTDRGSRYGVNAHNARAILLYKKEVEIALKSASKNEKHAASLTRTIETNWAAFGLTCATFALVYYLIFSPFHATVSKNIQWIEVKNAIQLTKEKLETLNDSESKPFDVFKLALAREDVSQDTKDLFKIGQSLYQEADETQIRFVKKMTSDMARRVLIKFKKDTDDLLKANIPDDKKLPWTNRRSESSFAHLKKVMLKIKNLGDEKFPELGQASINGIGPWLYDKVSKHYHESKLSLTASSSVSSYEIFLKEPDEVESLISRARGTIKEQIVSTQTEKRRSLEERRTMHLQKK